MPVTLTPSDVLPSSAGKSLASSANQDFPKSPRALLQRRGDKELVEVYQSSFAGFERDHGTAHSPDKPTVYLPRSRNGFVGTCIQAYNQHHRLSIRPDDVWLTILTQFSFYVNANAEKLRHSFVAHKDKKELTVHAVGNRYSVDFGSMAEQMGDMIQENVVDPDLHQWIVPSFTTTTPNDRIVSSVVMMATLKEYFSYKFCLCCGLPAVTLLGEKTDWEELLEKAQKLTSFGPPTEQWHQLLKPVLTNFVRSFDEPDSPEIKTFWQSIAHYQGGGSGPRYLCGWITAFCFFDADGKKLYSPEGFTRRYIDVYQLDGVKYHRIDTNDIPPAYASVDVKLDDNGLELDTVMVAGSVGIRVTSSTGELDDTVQPVAGWWIYQVDKSATASGQIQ